MSNPSRAGNKTEQKLQRELSEFEQRYQPENLRGLSLHALEKKEEQARAEAANILGKFTSKEIDEVVFTLNRCQDNIVKVHTERKDEIRERQHERRNQLWERLNGTLSALSTLISRLLP